MEQPVWTDPASGYVRRNLSPAARSPIQLVEVVFPAGQRVACDCLAMRLDRPTVFRNPTRKPARYLVARATLPFNPTRRN